MLCHDRRDTSNDKTTVFNRSSRFAWSCSPPHHIHTGSNTDVESQSERPPRPVDTARVRCTVAQLLTLYALKLGGRNHGSSSSSSSSSSSKHREAPSDETGIGNTTLIDAGLTTPTPATAPTPTSTPISTTNSNSNNEHHRYRYDSSRGARFRSSKPPLYQGTATQNCHQPLPPPSRRQQHKTPTAPIRNIKQQEPHEMPQPHKSVVYRVLTSGFVVPQNENIVSVIL